MIRTGALIVPLFALVIAMGACEAAATPFVPPAPPTEAAALAYLRTVVDIAQRGDAQSLCNLGSGNCDRALDDAGGLAATPAAFPTVAGSIAIQPTRNADGTASAGGRLLVVCGIDRRGRPFDSDVLVFYDDDGKLTSIEPVYWSGGRIDLTDSTGDAGIARPPRRSPVTPGPS